MRTRNCDALLGIMFCVFLALANLGCAGGSTTPPPPPLTVTTSALPNGTVNVPYSVTLQSSGGTPPVRWSLDPRRPLPPGLSLSSDGTISGTPTAPGSAALLVSALDSTAPTPQDAGQDLGIGINAADTSHNAFLKGQYAFIMSGVTYTKPIVNMNTVRPDATAGSFIADGLGSLTSGVSDTNSNGGVAANQPFTGTYSLGSDNRGTMSINSSAGTVTLAFSVGSISSGVAAKGRIINFGTPGGSGPGATTAGEFDLQDTTAFSTSAISGTYAFGLGGGCQICGVFGADGVFTADGTGNLLTGGVDTNQEGTFTPDQQLNGTYGVASSAFGRGTASLTFGGTTLDMTFYVISANKLLLISAEQLVFFGQAFKQSGEPFSNGSLQGAGVLYTIAYRPDLAAGLATFDGAGTINLLQDQNNRGAVASGIMTSESYSVAGNGRVTLTAAGSTVSSLYLVSPGAGFILNADSNAGTGFLEPQSAGPFSNSSINGSFFFGDPSPSPFCCGTLAISGVVTPNAGSLNQTSDANAFGNLSYDQTSADTYSVSSNGRATTGSGNEVIYIVSPSKFIIIDVNPSDAHPTIRVFEQ